MTRWDDFADLIYKMVILAVGYMVGYTTSGGVV